MARSRLSRRSNSEPAMSTRKVEKARRSKTPDPKSTARRTSECSSPRSQICQFWTDYPAHLTWGGESTSEMLTASPSPPPRKEKRDGKRGKKRVEAAEKSTRQRDKSAERKSTRQDPQPSGFNAPKRDTSMVAKKRAERPHTCCDHGQLCRKGKEEAEAKAKRQTERDSQEAEAAAPYENLDILDNPPQSLEPPREPQQLGDGLVEHDGYIMLNSLLAEAAAGQKDEPKTTRPKKELRSSKEARPKDTRIKKEPCSKKEPRVKEEPRSNDPHSKKDRSKKTKSKKAGSTKDKKKRGQYQSLADLDDFDFEETKKCKDDDEDEPGPAAPTKDTRRSKIKKEGRATDGHSDQKPADDSKKTGGSKSGESQEKDGASKKAAAPVKKEELRPRWEKYKIEADFDPIRLFYIGVWTREQVEDRYLRPVLFRLYHRYPSKLKKYNDLTHRLRLYVVYVTSRKEHRHYRIRTRQVSLGVRSSISDTQQQFCVKLPKEDAPYFNSLDALVRYYATNCCFQFGPGVEAVPDIFPWWTEDPAARDAKKAARKAARLTAKKIITKKSKSSTN